jgi:hypothetical protein
MTHWDGCWDAGPRHYECAVTRIRALEQDRDRLREAIDKFIASYPWGPCMPELAGLNAALEKP